MLKTPNNPQEAIGSRRNPCYGFAIAIDIGKESKLTSDLTEIRDALLSTIDPDIHLKKHPIHSPLYIKQKSFHASIFAMTPYILYEEIKDSYNPNNGFLSNTQIEKMTYSLKNHLKEDEPHLSFIKCEITPKDGTIIARFAYKTNKEEELPLRSLVKKLDPEKKFSSWDSGNELRFKTVAIAICVVDIEKLPAVLDAIQKQLDSASSELQKYNELKVDKYKVINFYDKRTLSKKHIFLTSDIALA